MGDLDVGAVDLTDPGLYEQGFPHDVFADLRRAGPVHRHPSVRVVRSSVPVAFWSVVQHAEIQLANRDWATFTALDGPGLAPTAAERRGHTIVSMDPPDHSRMRRLVSAGFTPRMVAALEERIVARTELILGAVEARGECELVSEVAYQLPMHVIADIIGIPEADRPWVFERTDAMLRAIDPRAGLGDAERVAPERELFQYAQALGRHKREGPGDDIWTLLIDAVIAGDDGTPTSLSELELDMFFVILALAGSETTRNAISQGLMALLGHPDQLADLRADPGLLPSAVDEMIRWASPVLYFGRTATRDVELGGARIEAGDRVVLWYPSGNRDERAFVDPFRFDIRRSPNPHVSFGGGGPHYCLGANLARKEISIMIGSLLSRFTEIEIVGDPVWSGAGPAHNVGVSIDELPVRVTAGSRP
jgi:cytochrome P450